MARLGARLIIQAALVAERPTRSWAPRYRHAAVAQAKSQDNGPQRWCARRGANIYRPATVKATAGDRAPAGAARHAYPLSRGLWRWASWRLRWAS